ncbi:MAG: hypothetical protein ACLQBK_25420 [Candidatus Sulfotelmatobacter sp.]
MRDSNWKTLYRVGGVAALLAAFLFRRNLAEEFLLFRGLGIIRSGPSALPNTVMDWYSVLHHYRLIGLTFLNLFDMVNYALIGLMFLGLDAALRRVNRSCMRLATTLVLVAVAVYFASNQAFAMVSLSDQYATAATDAQRSELLAAGQALLAIHNSGANYGHGIYLSYLFVNLAGLIAATVMLRSRVFGRAAAYTGILANAFGLGYYVTQMLAPTMSVIPISAAAPFLLVWYILIGRKLLQLGWGGLKEEAP